MNKKIGLSIILFLFLIIITILFIRSKKQGATSPVSSIPSTQKNKSGELKEYVDPSGYTFSVPKNLLLSAKESRDQTVYSELEISSPDADGKMVIKAVASTLGAVDDYFKNKKTATNAAHIEKLKLADLDARQFTTGSQLTTIALDQGVLFSIAADSKKNMDYWKSVNKTVIGTFAFALPDTATSSTSNQDQSGGADITEEEEIVE